MGKQRTLTKEDKKLAKRIKEIRKEKGMSQEELSNKIGANLSYVVYLETGRRGISLPMLYKISKALGVKTKDLFTF